LANIWQYTAFYTHSNSRPCFSADFPAKFSMADKVTHCHFRMRPRKMFLILKLLHKYQAFSPVGVKDIAQNETKRSNFVTLLRNITIMILLRKETPTSSDDIKSLTNMTIQ
jgi:hypothetical protein